MIKGLGTDIVEVARIVRSIAQGGERLAERILTPSELTRWRESKAPALFLAKRFAAKEAASKALGTGIGSGVSWQDIAIEHDPRGRPLLAFFGRALQRMHDLDAEQAWLSISDEKAYVVATVIIEG